MQTNVSQECLAVAQAKFKPVARALDRLAQDLEKEHGRSAVLEQRGPMQRIAQNAYVVRYSLRHPDEAQLSLKFTVVGDNADRILLQGHERSGPRDISANPGQVDQRVYRLERTDEIKEAVQEKISAHFRNRVVADLLNRAGTGWRE